MAKVNICNVEVKNNPSMFKEKFQFEITFDCIENLSEGNVIMLSCSMLGNFIVLMSAYFSQYNLFLLH